MVILDPGKVVDVAGKGRSPSHWTYKYTAESRRTAMPGNPGVGAAHLEQRRPDLARGPNNEVAHPPRGLRHSRRTHTEDVDA